jgi:hypothetical protein
MAVNLQFVILFDVESREPFSIWLSDGKKLDYYFTDEYKDDQFEYQQYLDNVDVSQLNLKEFWEYWATQRDNVEFAGPFTMATDKTLPELGKDAIDDLEAFVAKVKREGHVIGG